MVCGTDVPAQRGGDHGDHCTGHLALGRFGAIEAEHRRLIGVEPISALLDSASLDRVSLERFPAAVKTKARHLNRLDGDRHQGGHVTPKIERPEIELRTSHPRLGSADVLDHHWNMPACAKQSLFLDTKALVEQSVEFSQSFACLIGPDCSSFRFCQ